MIRKKITKDGSITLPRLIRQESGILPGVVVNIEHDDGEIRIKKSALTCQLCGRVEDVKTVCGIDICKDCADKILEEFNEKTNE